MTVLVTIVAVFLSYNANTGLPFVPTYDLKANLPNASQLVTGSTCASAARASVRSPRSTPKRRPDGTTYAQITLKLDKEIEPLPADSTVLVRPRSTLGLKYLRGQPRQGQAGFKPGATIPIRQARPEVVEIDDFFNMFDDKARRGSQNSLDGFGTGLAGRGRDLNTAIDQLIRCWTISSRSPGTLPVPRTRIDRFFKSLAATAGEVAPVAEEQASLFVNLDATFTAPGHASPGRSSRTRSREAAHRGRRDPRLPDAAALPAQQRRLLPRAAAGVATLPHSAPILAERLPGRHGEPAQDDPR